MENDEKLRRATNIKAQDRLDTIQCYKKVFNSPEGQVVLEDLARKCYMVCPTHTEGDQALDLARKEGMRQVVCIIMRELEANTFDIINLIKETNKSIEKKREQLEFINTNDEVLNGGSDV